MAKKSQSEQQVTRISDYKKTFGSEAGKRVLHDMIKASFVLKFEYLGDPSEVVYREGARSAMARIFNMLKMDQEKLLKFVKEQEMKEEEDLYA